MRHFFMFLLSVLGVAALTLGEVALAQGALDQSGRDPFCQTHPFADQCKGTHYACAASPDDPACRGTVQACQQNPDDPACVNSESFCRRNPQAERCVALNAEKKAAMEQAQARAQVERQRQMQQSQTVVPRGWPIGTTGVTSGTTAEPPPAQQQPTSSGY